MSGLGADYLDGGAGADTFIYNSVADSRVVTFETAFGGVVASVQVDTIANFQSGLDRIDLRGIDANTLVDGNQAFVFTNSFTGAAGQLMYSSGRLSGDIDGDARADFTLNVAGAQRSDVLL